MLGGDGYRNRGGLQCAEGDLFPCVPEIGAENQRNDRRHRHFVEIENLFRLIAAMTRVQNEDENGQHEEAEQTPSRQVHPLAVRVEFSLDPLIHHADINVLTRPCRRSHALHSQQFSDRGQLVVLVQDDAEATSPTMLLVGDLQEVERAARGLRLADPLPLGKSLDFPVYVLRDRQRDSHAELHLPHRGSDFAA